MSLLLLPWKKQSGAAAAVAWAAAAARLQWWWKLTRSVAVYTWNERCQAEQTGDLWPIKGWKQLLLPCTCVYLITSPLQTNTSRGFFLLLVLSWSKEAKREEKQRRAANGVKRSHPEAPQAAERVQGAVHDTPLASPATTNQPILTSMAPPGGHFHCNQAGNRTSKKLNLWTKTTSCNTETPVCVSDKLLISLFFSKMKEVQSGHWSLNWGDKLTHWNCQWAQHKVSLHCLKYDAIFSFFALFCWALLTHTTHPSPSHLHTHTPKECNASVVNDTCWQQVLLW